MGHRRKREHTPVTSPRGEYINSMTTWASDQVPHQSKLHFSEDRQRCGQGQQLTSTDLHNISKIPHCHLLRTQSCEGVGYQNKMNFAGSVL